MLISAVNFDLKVAINTSIGQLITIQFKLSNQDSVPSGVSSLPQYGPGTQHAFFPAKLNERPFV